jgi:hypothetical protein
VALTKGGQNYKVKRRRRGKKTQKRNRILCSKNNSLQGLKLSSFVKIYKIRNFKLFRAGFNGQAKNISD